MRVYLIVLICLLLGTAAWSQDNNTTASPQSSDTVTISRSEFEDLKAAVADLRKEVDELKGKQAQTPATTEQNTETPAAPEATAPEAAAPSEPTGGGKPLALPDISLVAQAISHGSTDKNDEAKNRVLLREAEIGIQGYVYPDVKADAFLTTNPDSNTPMSVEEAYLTYIAPVKGLNLYVGEKHVPFGRTDLLHDHSWLYVNPPKVLYNLVGSEALEGTGVDASYVIPTGSNLFAQLDLGAWTGQCPELDSSLNTPNATTDSSGILSGPGAAFADRFTTARLWTGYPVSDNDEVELGGSYANGAGARFDSSGLPIYDPTGSSVIDATLTGLDLSYRHFGEADSRLLLRAESVWRHQSTNDFQSNTADGYYLFGNYRWDKNNSIGLLYDWSEYPEAPLLHESALSLIYTKQFSEQYYVRLEASHGSRPEGGGGTFDASDYPMKSYNELWLQWVWGVGPHTHNLE
jgi:hypothetical protein